MKLLFTIALLALIGCAGNKPAKTLPTCEEFYDFYKNSAERMSRLWELPETEIDTIYYKRLEILENGVKKYNCKETITCDEKTYCFESMFF